MKGGMGENTFDVERVFSAVLFRGAALAQRALASLRAAGGDFGSLTARTWDKN